MEIKLHIQLWLSVLMILAGIVLLYLGFVSPPSGEIHSSIHVAFGELATFAGSLLGLDYHYRFKEYEVRNFKNNLKDKENGTC